mmetsp:Transcript_22866/g.42330  ORF Transcript_22866/g.42330 Transcript_22866/m.42330 type:complete len:265 (-) Transcript_22866:1533-2327(-)
MSRSICEIFPQRLNSSCRRSPLRRALLSDWSGLNELPLEMLLWCCRGLLTLLPPTLGPEERPSDGAGATLLPAKLLPWLLPVPMVVRLVPVLVLLLLPAVRFTAKVAQGSVAVAHAGAGGTRAVPGAVTNAVMSAADRQAVRSAGLPVGLLPLATAAVDLWRRTPSCLFAPAVRVWSGFGAGRVCRGLVGLGLMELGVGGVVLGEHWAPGYAAACAGTFAACVMGASTRTSTKGGVDVRAPARSRKRRTRSPFKLSSLPCTASR